MEISKQTKTIIFITLAIIIILAIFVLPDKMTRIKLETTHGEIVINLYNDMQITTKNFENLIKKGIYDGVIFHRIINGFMIQGGDPTGTGYGDPKIPNTPMLAETKITNIQFQWQTQDQTPVQVNSS